VGRYSFAGGATSFTQYRDGDDVEFASVGVTMAVKEIYADVAGKVGLR